MPRAFKRFRMVWLAVVVPAVATLGMRKEITILLMIALAGCNTPTPSQESGTETRARAIGKLEFITFPEILPGRKPCPLFTAVWGGDQPDGGFRLDAVRTVI